MANLNDLNTLFSGIYSVRFRPILNSLHLDVPALDHINFGHANTILKTAALQAPLSLSLGFKNNRWISLTIDSATESITIEKLRPMYAMEQKLLRYNPQTVELCLFSHQHSGMYIGTEFRLKLVE